MANTLYSHALRILTCAQCGAPVDASAAGGSFACGYCQASNVFARRDESADLSAAQTGRASEISESERYARLRQQDQQAAPLPEGIARLLVDGHLPAERVPEAEAMWRQVRSEIAITPSFPICERFFHLTVILARHFEERVRRAALETAVELLPDGGHRHVLRCMLAREAAKAQDFAAAEAWLAPVNPRPTDLEQDTAYRLAAATLASARHDYPKVAELLGFRRDDVPLEDRNEVSCWILRIDALEHLGREADASREMSELVSQWGSERMRHAIEAHLPLRLCVRSFGDASQAEAAREREAAQTNLRAELHSLEVQRQRLDPSLTKLFTQLVVGTAILTFLFGTVWTCVVSSIAEADPLFGFHARMTCSHVCEDCRAPYHFVSWSTTTNGSSSSTLDVYCSDDGGRIEGMAQNALWMSAVQGESWLARYELRGGIWIIGLTMQLFFAPFALVFVFSSKLRGWFKRREQRARLSERIEAKRAQL